MMSGNGRCRGCLQGQRRIGIVAVGLRHCLYVHRSIVSVELEPIEFAILTILEQMLKKLDMSWSRIVTIS